MASQGALSFDVTSDVSNFSRAMALVESTAKSKAASFALEFTGASRKVDDALGGVGKRAAVQITDGLSAAAKRFEADFTKATANVNRELGKSLAGIRANGLPNLSGVGALAAGVAGIALAYVTVTGAIEQANAQIEQFITLGSNAERAGVGVEFFQRFTEAAKDAKLSVQEIEAALKAAGAAVTQRFEQADPIKARLNELFETGYLGGFQSKGLADYSAANSNEQRIRAAVEAMRELRDLGEGLAAIDLAEKLFGADTAERIRSGRLEIEAIATALDRKRADLITQEQVATAQEYRERLDEAYRAIDDALHVSVALEGAGRAVLNVWLAIAEATANAATVAGGFLDKMLAAAKAARDAQPVSALQSPLAPRAVQEGEGNLGADLGGVAGRGARGRTLYPEPIGPQQPEMSIVNPPGPPRRPLSFFTERDRVETGGAKKPASESLDQVETFINSIERSTEALKAEVDAIGKSSTERQAAINIARLEATARQQGITLTQEQVDKTRTLSVATAEYREKLEDARDAQEAMRQTGGDMLRGLYSDARNGASAMDLLSNAVGRLADRLANRSLDSFADTLFGRSGGQNGSGILGSLFGGSGGPGLGDVAGFFSGASSPIPRFDVGGYTGAGGRLQPAGVVHRGEYVISAPAVARIGLPTLNALHRGLPGFADGGLVGADMLASQDRKLGLASTPRVSSDAVQVGGPTVNVINNGPPMQAKVERRSDGSLDLILDQVEARMASRIARGQGPMSKMVGGGYLSGLGPRG